MIIQDKNLNTKQCLFKEGNTIFRLSHNNQGQYFLFLTPVHHQINLETLALALPSMGENPSSYAHDMSTCTFSNEHLLLALPFRENPPFFFGVITGLITPFTSTFSCQTL